MKVSKRATGSKEMDVVERLDSLERIYENQTLERRRIEIVNKIDGMITALTLLGYTVKREFADDDSVSYYLSTDED